MIELTVERLDDGEVSPYLHETSSVGDELEVRGPFGGWFVWRGDTPVLLVAGGSGIVPLMAMLRTGGRRTGRSCRSRCSCRCARRTTSTTPSECRPETTVRLHARAPAGLRAAGRSAGRRRPGAARRAARAGRETVGYVCGSAGFAEHASQLLVELGVDAGAVRVERFGPS